MRGEGHVGLNMALAAPVFLFYPGSPWDRGLWVWFLLYLAMATWPDLDLRFELRHRGVTHTVVGAVAFGAVGALLAKYAFHGYVLEGFLGGFTGTLGHILGDLLTYERFRPLWPFSEKRYALRLFRTRNRVVNRAFAAVGSACLVAALAYRAYGLP